MATTKARAQVAVGFADLAASFHRGAEPSEECLFALLATAIQAAAYDRGAAAQLGVDAMGELRALLPRTQWAAEWSGRLWATRTALWLVARQATSAGGSSRVT